MKIATWNVNSVRARLTRLLAWLQRTQPDIVCLQELKAREEAFPYDAIREAGCCAMVGLSFFMGFRPDGDERLTPPRTKKADVAKHPKVFDHVGLLFNEPPGTTGSLFI